MTELDAERSGNCRDHADRGLGLLRPLDESYAAWADLVVEQPGLLPARSLKPLAVKVRDQKVALFVAIANGVARARHGPIEAERAAGAADEGRLAAADLTADVDDGAGCELIGELSGERFSLFG